jgi:hypothetical protein
MMCERLRAFAREAKRLAGNGEQLPASLLASRAKSRTAPHHCANATGAIPSAR